MCNHTKRIFYNMIAYYKLDLLEVLNFTKILDINREIAPYTWDRCTF